MRPARLEIVLADRLPTTLAAILVGWVVAGVGSAAGEVAVTAVRHWSAPDHTRIVLDLSCPAEYEVRRVGDPERLVINVARARFRYQVPMAVNDGLVRQLRRNQASYRAQVVVDLAAAATYRHFALPAAQDRPARIVLDVFRPPLIAAPTDPNAGAVLLSLEPPPGGASATSAAGDLSVDGVAAGEAGTTEPSESTEVGGHAAADRTVTPAAAAATRPFIVVIDPGHGGMDPGAVRGRLQEKDLALDIAREMAALINAVPGYRAVLTRTGDFFVSLAERVRIAQRAGGDLFLSIHCNTHRKQTIGGMEVYFLTLQGATDREAQELADKENAADLVGLAPDEVLDDSVLSILMDLRMTRVLDHSSRLAESVLGAARASKLVEARKVKQARFQVLRSLAMPSALIEVAYLSNEADRRLLSSPDKRRQLAALVVRGMLRYRGEGAEPVLLAAQQVWSLRYKVRSGDTLWRIAGRHRTTIDEIRERNDLRSASIRVGQVLSLPAAD